MGKQAGRGRGGVGVNYINFPVTKVIPLERPGEGMGRGGGSLATIPLLGAKYIEDSGWLGRGRREGNTLPLYQDRKNPAHNKIHRNPLPRNRI